MSRILIGGQAQTLAQISNWLAAWGLEADDLAGHEHPASVDRRRAQVVLFAGDHADPDPALLRPMADAAPLILVGPTSGDTLKSLAWAHVEDPGSRGDALAEVLRPCLDASLALGADGASFRDFLNHELRTPLTAAGMALQTLALHLEPAGGPSLGLVETAMRNIRRLEQTVEWATDYVADDSPSITPEGADCRLIDLLEDLDDLQAGVEISWASGVGDWQAEAGIDRGRWRRLLRQVVRAVAYRRVVEPVHLDVSLVGDGGGLLLVFSMPLGPTRGDLADGDEEQLRRLLGFTVHPDLARYLGLRHDVVRTTEHLRLRILLEREQSAVAVECVPESDNLQLV